MTTLSTRRNIAGWGFSAPFAAILGLFLLIPIAASLVISFTSFSIGNIQAWGTTEFVGLDNYTKLFSDPRFMVAVRNTAFYTIVSVPLGMLISLGLALALNQAIAGISWIRTMYFLPIVTSTIAIGLVWSWIYSPSNGLLNQFIGIFGVPPQRWVADPFWAMPAIVVMSVWQGLGTTVIIFLAGLQGIPEEYYDAAAVDGAGPRARFRHVTLPLLTPSIFFTGILALIDSFLVFDQVYVLARPGRPTDATVTLVYTIYENGFQNFKMGYAAAGAWVLFIIVAALAAIYFRLQNRWVHYQ